MDTGLVKKGECYMKVLSIVGARPQFVKAAILSEMIRKHGEEILCHTGQHYDDNMSRVFFSELGIPEPDIHLGIGGGSHAGQTGQMMIGIENVILEHQPDWVVVYGDTNSTLAGALAAAKLQVRVAHVEAGLRSFNREMPEEINRVVCDHVSDLLFCPSGLAVQNLGREGITSGVHMVGDVMADVLQRSIEKAKRTSKILEALDIRPGSYILATIHRAGNTDDVSALNHLLAAFGQLGRSIIFPIHPRTRAAIQNAGLSLPPNIRDIDPVGYLDMLQLESNADCIMTDSGGMQKEAYWLGVRCVTLRTETEWPETVELGWNCLVGTDPELIQSAVQDWHPAGDRPAVYGDGHAAEKIALILEQSG